MPDIASLLVRVGADVAGAERGLRSVQDGITGLGKTAAAVGAGMTAGITAPLVAGLAGAVSVAAEFEQTMNVLQAAAGATGEEMAQLSGLAKDLGNDLALPGTSASDAAEAMTELVKAGLSVTDTMSAAKGVLQLSAAAQVSNAEAAEITANALNAFGLAGTEATRVADLLAGAANASSSDIAELGMGMSQASAVFKAANQPIEVLVNSMAMMANAGIKGSDGATSLKTAVMALMAPTKEAAAALAEMGVQTRDAEGQMRLLPDIMDDIGKAAENMGEAQRDAALKTIFGSDAIRAGIILSEQGAEGYNKMAAATQKAGLAALAAAAQTKGLTGAWEGLKSTVETLALSIGEKLLPVLTTLVQFASKVVGALSDLPGPVQAMLAVLVGLAAAAGPALLAVGGAIAVIGGAAGGLATIIGAVTAVVSAIGGAIGVFAVGSASLGFFGAAAAALAPVLPVIAAALAVAVPLFVALGLAVAALATDFGGVRTALADNLLPALQALGTWLSGTALPAVLAFGQALATQLQPVLAAVGAAFASMLPALTAALAAAQAQLGPLGVALGELGAALVPLLPLLQPLAVMLGVALVGAIGLAVASLTGIIAMFAGALPGAIQVATGVIQVLSGTIESLVAVVRGAVLVIDALLRGDWAGAWEAAKATVVAWAAGVETTLTGFSNIVQGLFSALVGALTGLISGFVDASLAYFTSLSGGGVEQAEALKAGATDAITSLVSEALAKIGELATELVAKFVEMGSAAVAEVSTWPGRMIAALGTLKDQMLQAGKDAGQGLVDGLKSMLGAVAEAARQLADAAADAVRSALQIGSPSRVTFDIGRGIGQGLVNGIGSQESNVRAAAKDLGDAALDELALAEQKILHPTFAGRGQRSVTVEGQTITGGGFQFYKDLRDLAARTFAATGRLIDERVWPEAAGALAEWGLSAVLSKHPELAAAAEGPTGHWERWSAGGTSVGPTVVMNNTIANPLDASLVAQAAMDAIARG